MLAYQILSRTVYDLIGNATAALKISLPSLLTLIAFVVTVGGVLYSGTPTGDFDAEGFQNVDIFLRPLLFVAAAGLAFAAALCWTAVAWHRFIILGEATGAFLPRWPRRKVFGYAIRSLGIMVVLILISLAVSPLFYFGDRYEDGSAHFVFGTLPDPLTAKNIVMGIAAGTFVGAFSLRFSTILPAYAVDRPLPRGATAGEFFSCFVPLAFAMNMLFVTMETIALFFPLGVVVGILLGWLQLMISIGILTRLYLRYASSPLDTSV